MTSAIEHNGHTCFGLFYFPDDQYNLSPFDPKKTTIIMSFLSSSVPSLSLCQSLDGLAVTSSADQAIKRGFKSR